MNGERPIGVIGVGWVGLVTATCFAEMGHEVIAMDIDASKVHSLNRGRVPIHEPGIDELLERNGERLTFTTTMEDVLEDARLLFCCVDTPPTYSGDADLSRVQAVVSQLADDGDHALVMKSTVPSGTGRTIRRDAPQLAYVSCPEFLKEGTAVQDFLHPDRVVIGADAGAERAGNEVEAVYRPLGGEIVRTGAASAEMITLAANAFLATKISFINEIANVCEEVGADAPEVSRGMGLDERIGPQFLRPGIGYGGSCFDGRETVLARRHGRTELLRLDRLWDRLQTEHGEWEDGVVAPANLEVLSWVPHAEAPQFLPVMALTRRDYEGELLEVCTKMGRRIRCTPDHPWIVGDGDGGDHEVKLAEDLTTGDWVPLALGRRAGFAGSGVQTLLGAVEAAELDPERVIVRIGTERAAEVAARPIEERRPIFARSPSRLADIKRNETMRLDEAWAPDLPTADMKLGTARNGAFLPISLPLDRAFWRVVGLYIAEGCFASGARNAARIMWSFHPDREQHLVDEVMAFWLRHGIPARAKRKATAHTVTVQSRLLGAWWTRVLGLGRNGYEQRLPDLIWDRPDEDKWALLAALWEGDGSWSLINGGPSVSVEFGTISDELADGVHRLLGDLGIVASQRIVRTKKSTKDTYWLRIAGADQVKRAIELVPERDRVAVLSSIARQSKRIAPTRYRRSGDGPAWLRITDVRREPFSGPVYSLEVPAAHTVVLSHGITPRNCFPKDVSALKQLAGNSGYHFQLLTAVIEVNELQKRRVVSKLQKHLGSLVGKQIALLGLAFKPNTDDIREATALVLAARLQSEGAHVRVYDPVAMGAAAELIGGAKLCDSAVDALDGADGAVLVTEWPEFAQLDWTGEVKERMGSPLVVDGRNFLDRDALVSAGFTYEGVGRSSDVAAPVAS